MYFLLKTLEDGRCWPSPWSRGLPGNVSKLGKDLGEDAGRVWFRRSMEPSQELLRLPLSLVKQTPMLHGETGGRGDLWFSNSVTPCLLSSGHPEETSLRAVVAL